ncbi:MAG: DEAD/DEAH box helicase family protein [Candidatus Uhrbacteria bacterium]|nr:DEAD/DEAH box helicase family protein [Candidatus Uhrbacteria bacterium]
MKKLRPHQIFASEALWECVSRGQTRALVVMATGLGKTVVASAFVRRWLQERGGRVLFLAQMQDILVQARDEFSTALGREVTGINTSANREHLAASVLFTTFQSIANQLQSYSPREFGLIVVDEAHHGPAPTYRRVIEHFAPDFLFGMTATPERSDKANIRQVFGKEVCSYPLSKALSEGLVADVDYYTLTDNLSIGVLREFVRQAGEQGPRSISRKQIDKAFFLPERLERITEIIRHEQRGDKQTIIFCRTIRHAEEVHKYFRDARPYHSRLPRSELRDTLADFRAKRLSTILVVDKFNEGIDIPDAELVAFLRTTDSQTIWLQQLGRGLRRTAYKQRVTVLDFVANCDRVVAIWELGVEVTMHESELKRDEPLVLEGTGWHMAFSEELRDLVKLLQQLQAQPYETWEEASVAVRSLGARTTRSYHCLSAQDPRLVSNPDYRYRAVWEENGGWPGFLGTDVSRHRPRESFYATYEEASVAARRLGIASSTEYAKRYNEDPHLPSSPRKFYADAWKNCDGWIGFLETDPARTTDRIHPTYAEASEAARNLGIRSIKEYALRYREDKLLPSQPYQAYEEDWKKLGSWGGFLKVPIKPRRRRPDVYQTYDEASVVARKLGIKTAAEYAAHYEADSKLPSNPNSVYASEWKKDGGWPGFLGTPVNST